MSEKPKGHKGESKGHSGLWGGRFEGRMAPEMVPLNRSLGVDLRLWSQDIRASQAWARALARAGVVSAAEGELLAEGLARVSDRISHEDFSQAPDEDVHSLVERLLGEEIGSLAGKLHTGRSRNDQVATDFRLWGMEIVQELDRDLHRLLTAILSLSESGLDLILPGYTHLQRAQPIRAAHWALSHFWPVVRDRNRIRDAKTSAGVLPLGSGALAGCPFPIDREWLRKELGFGALSQNSLDAVADRDWAAEMAFAAALLGTHISRLGEDLVLFSSREFAFLRLSDGFSTGSSLMPQKRNPDVAELSRGKVGRLVGNLTGFLTLLKGLPTGYNRDLQEDKELLFDSIDTLLLVLPALAEALATARFDTEGLKGSGDTELLATDVADYLVEKGVPFRESHEVVGKLVREGEERGIPISQLPLTVFRKAHAAFQEDVRQRFSWERSVEARKTVGGTARDAVLAQLEEGRRVLGS